MGTIRHSVQRTGSVLGVLGVLALILLGLYMVWVTVIQPHTRFRVASTQQKAERIVNYNIDIHKESCLIDFKLLGIRLSTLCRDTKTREIITQEEKRKDVD